MFHAIRPNKNRIVTIYLSLKVELTQIETKVKPKKKHVSTCKSISTHPHTPNPVVPFITLTNHDNDGPKPFKNEHNMIHFTCTYFLIHVHHCSVQTDKVSLNYWRNKDTPTKPSCLIFHKLSIYLHFFYENHTKLLISFRNLRI